MLKGCATCLECLNSTHHRWHPQCSLYYVILQGRVVSLQHTAYGVKSAVHVSELIKKKSQIKASDSVIHIWAFKILEYCKTVQSTIFLAPNNNLFFFKEKILINTIWFNTRVNINAILMMHSVLVWIKMDAGGVFFFFFLAINARPITVF